MHAAINPPNPAENIELPYLWLRNDGGAEPDRGHSVSFSWPAYPSVWKAARTISARHALLSENLGQKYVTAHYRQAKLYSRNLINIATQTRFRQHGRPANRDKAAQNQPSKPALVRFVGENRASCVHPPLPTPVWPWMLKKSPQESTLNSLLYYAQSSISQDAGKKPTLPPLCRTGPYCFICVTCSRLWRF